MAKKPAQPIRKSPPPAQAKPAPGARKADSGANQKRPVAKATVKAAAPADALKPAARKPAPAARPDEKAKSAAPKTKATPAPKPTPAAKGNPPAMAAAKEATPANAKAAAAKTSTVKAVPKAETAKPAARADNAKPIPKPDTKAAKVAPPPTQPASTPPVATAPASGKPSVGEIAAKIAGKRAEDAATKKGKGGKHAEIVTRVPTPAEVAEQKRRLKNLIVLGKERGYLTYAEINDHLPDDVLDAEQIEGIISMIGDMGIQVFDQAPDAETLLMGENTPAAPGEDVEEEAEAAVSTLDSEFGRTTDPVRMYMREMGSVELLTREGEIAIAKRIEEGLKHMIMAISACPLTVQQILDLAEKIAQDELKIDDLVDGLMDFDE
ncbi:MAG: RNA polymerase sigma factor RpoD, partial [Acidobacteria bacterium]|nr:RNA polymerase sigma factor RpoD [Acidobacteriota bacterium]